MRRAALLVAASLLLVCCGGEPPPVPAVSATGLLPDSGASAGWQRAGDTRLFRGAELYGHINGGSEVFLELGFDRLEVQDYANGGDELSVELYHMTDAAAALGIYLMKCGVETPAAGLPCRNTSSDSQLHLVQGSLYLVVNNLSGTAAAAEALPELAAAVAARGPTATPVHELDQLTVAGRVPGSERIVRGPYTLQALYTLGDGDILSLADTGTTAVAADYGDPAAPDTLIIADYGTADAARTAFARLDSGLDEYLKPTVRKPDLLVFEDWQQRYGIARLDGSRLQIRVNLRTRPEV